MKVEFPWLKPTRICTLFVLDGQAHLLRSGSGGAAVPRRAVIAARTSTAVDSRTAETSPPIASKEPAPISASAEKEPMAMRARAAALAWTSGRMLQRASRAAVPHRAAPCADGAGHDLSAPD
jgi:hypothetical protein